MTNDTIRSFCLSLPATEEDVKWGNDLCFTVGKKMYCVEDTSGTFGVAFKCSDEDFALLLERDGIIPAPYLARNKWVKVQKAGALSKDEWFDYVKKSYEYIKAKLTRKMKADLGLSA
jgi:predicted DNA-binding protein (MmcQ/YjbR family)